MSQLICPLCGENLEEEGVHFFKHFKYKKYPCGENSCDLEFYAETDRNAHCSKHGHKRSFQKSVNPYIDKLIGMIVSDARELATKDMETVLENRWGADPDISIIAPPKPSPDPSARAAKKRSLIVEKTPGTTSKKTKQGREHTTSHEISSSRRTHEETPRRPAKETPSSSSSRPPITTEVDSTTNDTSAAISSSDKQKRVRKKKTVVEVVPLASQSYAEMSALDKLVGWYDPNVPERKDAAKVDCAVCRQQIVYDYILRKSHVSSAHMAADIAPEDYEDLLKTAMDKSFPELPNSNMACQLCMTCVDIPKNRRREHIEKCHTTSLPPLECPFEDCRKGYRRQCDLSSHMKDSHKSEMSKHKNSGFQKIRRHRNVMINTLIDKCFPWATLEAYEKPEKKQLSKSLEPSTERMRTNSEQAYQPIGEYSLDSDVRVLERSVNKTRRAPQYNHRDSSSDSSDSEGEDHQVEDGGRDESPLDYAQDIIYIGEKFNSEVAEKLSQRNVKTEIVETGDDREQHVEHGSDVLVDAPIEVVDPEGTTKEEVSEEDMKDESESAVVSNISLPVQSSNDPVTIVGSPEQAPLGNVVEKYEAPAQKSAPSFSRPGSRLDSSHQSSRGFVHPSSSSNYNRGNSSWIQEPWHRGNGNPSSSSSNSWRNFDRPARRYSPNRNWSSSSNRRPRSRSRQPRTSSYNREYRRF